ncbi:MAG TPA: FkbM family methyltransferase [Chitinophagaceae bacterium]|nr:FkbM family methyltransferase [Chitinophagaceae bacterium]
MEIENDIFWKGLTGGWEKISMQLWIQLSRKANIILDIGANTGLYALTAKLLNAQALVFAFEPLKQMYRKLKENNDLNDFDIDCIEKAVSDKNGKAIIYETGADHIAAASLNIETRAYTALDLETEVETITLDSFIDEKELKKIDLVKIDVETHEPSVLKGFKKYLPQHRPDFIIEVLTDKVGSDLEQLLNGLGYLYFNIDDKEGKIHKVDRITKSDYFNYLLCSEETARYLKLL